jgi:phosphate transport system substrate-binding protein
MKKVICLLVIFAAVSAVFFSFSAIAADKEAKVITLSGAFAVYPTAVAWGEEYQKIHPAVKVEVSAGGAGKGAADCIAGMVDIGMVSRDPDKAELDQGVTAIPICHDGVFVIVNEKSPFIRELLKTGITKATLFDLYKNQKKLSFEELVKKESKTRTAVNIYTRSDSCGAAATFAKFIGGLKQEDLSGIGVNTDPQMINAVINDVNGISYANFSYVFGKDGKIAAGVKVIPIDKNENGKIEDEEKITSRADAIAAIEKGIYPIARKNFFFFKGAPKGTAKDFLTYCLSDEGTKVLEQVGTSLPMPKEDRKKILGGLK